MCCTMGLCLLHHQDDSLSTDHSEAVNCSTNNAQYAAMTSTFCYIQLVLHCLQCYLSMTHISSQQNLFGNTLKPENAMNFRNTTCVLN